MANETLLFTFSRLELDLLIDSVTRNQSRLIREAESNTHPKLNGVFDDKWEILAKLRSRLVIEGTSQIRQQLEPIPGLEA